MLQGLYAGVSAPLVGVTPMCTLSFPILSFTLITHALSSRRLLLGLRCRQITRPLFLPRHTPPNTLHYPSNLRRRLLLRHPHDPHHCPLRARKSSPANPRAETACSRRETEIQRRAGRRTSTIQRGGNKECVSGFGDDAGERWARERCVFRDV